VAVDLDLRIYLLALRASGDGSVTLVGCQKSQIVVIAETLGQRCGSVYIGTWMRTASFCEMRTGSKVIGMPIGKIRS